MSLSTLLLLLLVGAAVYAVILYNRLVALRQTTKNAFADIDVQLRQRHDLVPNLVETVKGYAAHEKGLFEKVAEARTAAMQAGTLQERGHAESALSSALSRLFAVAENYPDLKANENFRQLQTDLSDIENKIAAARRYFNNAVAEYNTALEQFPASLLAQRFNFQPSPMFDLGTEERTNMTTPPKVSFGG